MRAPNPPLSFDRPLLLVDVAAHRYKQSAVGFFLSTLFPSVPCVSNTQPRGANGPVLKGASRLCV